MVEPGHPTNRLVVKAYIGGNTGGDVRCCDACFLKLLEQAVEELRNRFINSKPTKGERS